MNARIRQSDHLWEAVLGRHGIGRCNGNGLQHLRVSSRSPFPLHRPMPWRPSMPSHRWSLCLTLAFISPIKMILTPAGMRCGVSRRQLQKVSFTPYADGKVGAYTLSRVANCDLARGMRQVIILWLSPTGVLVCCLG